MATVDIEPASLAVTPGESDVLTLTVRNDGDDVEAYHLTVVDDAADHVVIEPDTLLVHPGQTGTAAATLTLRHTGRWSVGDLIVRFHIVPAGHPDEFLVAEAIATIRSFSDVAAVLSPPSLEGRRSAEAEVAIANAGNAHTYADVSVSAGELVVALDRARATLPAGSSEGVDLVVRARSLLWRGEPEQHPFVVTVTPEGEQAISLEGTFTQRPVLSGWMFWTVVGVAAAVALALVVWIGAAALAGLRGRPAVETIASTPTETVAPAPVVDVAVDFDDPAPARAGDDAVAVLAAEVDGAPEGSLLAVEVTWPEGLALVASESTCEGWVGPEIDRELEGQPRSGDECLIEPSSSGEAELVFTTPPAGFADEVTAAATRLVAIDGGEVSEIEYAEESDFQDDDVSVPIDVQPYLFWMDVGTPEFSDEQGQVSITVHRTLDGTDPFAEMAFSIDPPAFVDLNDDNDGLLDQRCDDWDPDARVCTLQWFAGQDAYDIFLPLPITGSVPNAGVLELQGVSLSIDGQAVPDDDVREAIRGAEYPLVIGTGLFAVDLSVDPDQAQPGEVVEATVSITNVGFPAAVSTFDEGSWTLGLGLTWPEALDLGEKPATCLTFVGDICELRGPGPGKSLTVTIPFTVSFNAEEGGEVAVAGASLSFDPTTEADRHDGRSRPVRSMPPDWIGSSTADFSLE